ncbi:MAG TPA: type II toxin-antitoxin system HigB family toxin, partial [Ktedonobacterales bacterium]|nr:type II toxin-antitoxin system HigB family toxin [Ktedonobacterales bacterium]
FAICEHLGTMTVPLVMEGSLRVIAKRRLLELAGGHGDCIDQVNAWYSIASKATWHSLSEVRQLFPHADVVGDKTIFNIKGNDYRLIVHILYSKGIIYIRDLLTHAEYNKGGWK